MKTKSKTLALSGVVLFLFVILIKIAITIFSTEVIIKNIRYLEEFKEKELDVVKYMYDNYITLMKIDTIGLSLALMCGCLLINLSFFIKLKFSKKGNAQYKKIFTIIFSVANGLIVLSSMFTLFSEYIIFYTFTQYLLMFIIIMFIIDAIATFIFNEKSIIRLLKTILLAATLVSLVAGVFFHFNDIRNHLENNVEMIALQEELAYEYYGSIYGDSEEVQELIDMEVEKYLYAIKEFHSNKGYLVGMNNLSIEGYTYILKRDNVITLTTTLTVEEKAFYNTFTETLSVNYALLISLLGGIVVLLIGLMIDDTPKSKMETLITELITRIETYQAKVQAGTMTKEEYLELKQILFSQIIE